ncbi:MAG: TrkH family potassium uptake protein [Planctomycetota bacterium]|nr:MAG: TrkH family potassium uptake protein [Planctomycetota bacterium]
MGIREGGRRSPWLRAPVLVALGFVALILVGTVLLGLPQAVVAGHPPLTLVQALFTATSAACVTGLTVLSTAHELSGFGQTVVFGLFQLGGLGVMTLAVLVFESLRGRAGQESGEVMAATLGEELRARAPREALRVVLGGTLLFELVGFLLLLPALQGEESPAWKALFLSVSAFCNAGFDNLDQGLAPYAGRAAVGLPLTALWLLGGLGFLVPAALIARWREGRGPLAPAARMILVAGGLLAVAGPVIFFLCESFGGALSGRPLGEQVVLALFQGNTARTAGFSMLDLGEARRITLLTLIPMMLIGGAPGGTAGGMKTTTVWVFAAVLAARVRGQEDVVVLGRRVPQGVIRRAILVCSLMFLLHGLAALWLAAWEPPAAFRFEDLAFEAASALGTVGLSTGVTPELSVPSHLALVLVMLAGRLGPLTVAYALFRPMPGRGLRPARAEIPVG